MQFRISRRHNDTFGKMHLQWAVNSYQWNLFIGPFNVWLSLGRPRIHPLDRGYTTFTSTKCGLKGER